MDISHCVRVSLRKHIPSDQLKSEQDIENIIVLLTDLVKMIMKKEKTDIWVILHDILFAVRSIVMLSKETEIEIMKDIFEYIIHHIKE